jgi:hypothetical protein
MKCQIDLHMSLEDTSDNHKDMSFFFESLLLFSKRNTKRSLERGVFFIAKVLFFVL